MSKLKYKMFQCVLVRNVNGTSSMTVTWIPEKFAKIGDFIKLKVKDGVWTDGWMVKHISTDYMDSDICNALSRDYRGMATFSEEQVNANA